jgi:sarcosine oxidase, subunit alpha
MHILRAEKGFIIAGQDTDGSVNPMDLGMHGMLSKQKDYLGRRSLSRTDAVREDREQFVGLVTPDNPGQVIPEGAQLTDSPDANDAPKPVPLAGHVTSSYYSATLQRSIPLAMVRRGRERMDEVVYSPMADGRVIKARITSPVFHDPEGARQNV